MAANNLNLGPSYPSVTVMPAPNVWHPSLVEEAAANLSGDGTTYIHIFAQKMEWQGEWNDLTTAEMNQLKTEYKRKTHLALIDFDSTSYTVVVQPRSFQLELIPGQATLKWNVRCAFREV